MVSRLELDAPAADGDLLQRRADREQQHEVRHRLQEVVEGLRQRLDGGAGDVDVGGGVLAKPQGMSRVPSL